VADILVPFGANSDDSPKVRLVDQGDGTYAPRVDAAGIGGGGGGGGGLVGDATAAANATNNAATAVIAAPGAGNYTQITDIYFGYSAAPSAGATLTISATGITTVILPVTSAGPGPIRFPLRVPNNVATTITLSAGGSGVVGYVAAIYSTQAV